MQDAILMFLFFATMVLMVIAVKRYSDLKDEMALIDVRVISDKKYEKDPTTQRLVDYALAGAIHSLVKYRGLQLKYYEFIKNTGKHEYQTNMSNDVLNQYLKDAALGKVKLKGDDLELKVPEEKKK